MCSCAFKAPQIAGGLGSSTLGRTAAPFVGERRWSRRSTRSIFSKRGLPRGDRGMWQSSSLVSEELFLVEPPGVDSELSPSRHAARRGCLYTALPSDSSRSSSHGSNHKWISGRCWNAIECINVLLTSICRLQTNNIRRWSRLNVSDSAIHSYRSPPQTLLPQHLQFAPHHNIQF